MRLSYIVSSVVLIFLVASGESFVHAPYQVSRKTKKSNSEDYIEQSQTFFKKQKKWRKKVVKWCHYFELGHVHCACSHSVNYANL